MTLEVLEKARDNARKSGDKAALLAFNEVIAYIRKMETAGKKKVELTEQMVDEGLVRYCKMLKDSIKEFPEGNSVRLTYEEQLTILSEYAPAALEDEGEIEKTIVITLLMNNIPICKKNKGKMMKVLMPELRARHADMEVAMRVIDRLMTE